MPKDILLSVRDLKVHFQTSSGKLFTQSKWLHAVDGVSFDIQPGSTFGIVGESGSGKSTVALAIMRLVPIRHGEILLSGDLLSHAKGKQLKDLRKNVQIVFQDPYSSLNPRMRAGSIVREPLDLMEIGERSERDERVEKLFQSVGLRSEHRALFPHQFSGGQRQRIGIARALASQPNLIVCDEPVSALDVAIQAQILNLLRNLQNKLNLTYLFISHDLGVVQHVCDDIGVMYLGKIVERAERRSLFNKPLHPYTWALLSAVPSINRRRRQITQRVRLQGDPPNPIDLPHGCGFASRCPFVREVCRTTEPLNREIFPGHWVKCHLVSNDGIPPHQMEMDNSHGWHIE